MEKDLSDKPKTGSLVPYYMQNLDADNQAFEPWCFNNVTKWGDYENIASKAQNNDAFILNTDPGVSKIPLE